MNASLLKESNALEALNKQKDDLEKMQEKIENTNQKTKEQLLVVQRENESVQESLAHLKKELGEHNKTFESNSKTLCTKVIRLIDHIRSLKWSVSRQRNCQYCDVVKWKKLISLFKLAYHLMIFP